MFKTRKKVKELVDIVSDMKFRVMMLEKELTQLKCDHPISERSVRHCFAEVQEVCNKCGKEIGPRLSITESVTLRKNILEANLKSQLEIAKKLETNIKKKIKETQ